MPTPAAFFQGEFVPMENAKIGIMTHAFNYGTAVFEGIRGNWNDTQKQLYLFCVNIVLVPRVDDGFHSM